MSDTALLIIDFQEGNRDHIHEVQTVIVAAKRTLKKAREQKIPVLHFRFAGNEKDTRRFGSHTWTPPDTPEFEIVTELTPLPDEYVLDKKEYSAFSISKTDSLLKELGIKKIWLCGVMSQVCVLASSLDAYERDYEVQVVEDAVGATGPDNLEMGLTWMRKYTASLVLSKNL